MHQLMRKGVCRWLRCMSAEILDLRTRSAEICSRNFGSLRCENDTHALNVRHVSTVGPQNQLQQRVFTCSTSSGPGSPWTDFVSLPWAPGALAWEIQPGSIIVWKRLTFASTPSFVESPQSCPAAAACQP